LDHGNNNGGIVKVLPTHDRVLIELVEGEEIAQGGIVLPDAAKEKSNKGVVIAVGPGKTLDSGNLAPISVEPGVTVLFGRYATTKVKGTDKKLVLVKDEDILAVILEEKDE
jgi:chaperonin GroES